MYLNVRLVLIKSYKCKEILGERNRQKFVLKRSVVTDVTS